MAADNTTTQPITDGRSAWDEFFAGVTRTFEANESAVPAIALTIGVVALLVVNLAVARWLLRRWERSAGCRRPRC